MSFLKDPLQEPASDARPGWASVRLERAADGRREPRGRSGDPLDAETLEVVETFEKLYAGFDPPPEPRSNSAAAADDEFAIDLPDDVRETPRAEPPRYEKAAPADIQAETATIDATRAVRGAALRVADPVPRATPARTGERRPEAIATDAPDWSTKSRTAWPRLLVAAALALAIGVGVGYLAGRTPAPGAAAAKIETSPEGGSRLRFDYDLRKR